MNREHKKLERLMLFSEVARQLSFSKAAESLAMSRGYLSDQIKRLEKELAVPLLIRSTRNIRLTEDGEKIQIEVDKMKRSMADMERNIKNDRESLSGLVKITAPKLFSQRYLLDICHEFQQLHSEVRFDIDSSYTRHDLILSQFDLAFRATNTPPLNMIAKPILSYDQCCCASPDYLERYGRPTTVQDLQQHQCLHAPDNQQWTLGKENVDVDGWLSVNDNLMLKQQALMGRGIIKVAEYIVDEEIKRGELERVLPEYPTFSQTIYIIHPQLVLQNARLKAFIQFTQKWFFD